MFRRFCLGSRFGADAQPGQSKWVFNYAEGHRAGLRVGMAFTEATANFLVNRRMNKSQQMRWIRRGADRLLQVRCAVYNGTLGSGSGQRFEAPVGLPSEMPMAACPPESGQFLRGGGRLQRRRANDRGSREGQRGRGAEKMVGDSLIFHKRAPC